MKGCHSCEHANAITEGRFAGMAWDETPCSECDVMSGTGFAVEFDEGRLGPGSQHEEREGHEVIEEVLPVSVMQEAMVGFLNLNPELRDVVAWRYVGMKYEEIAQLQGVTMACVEKRHRRAMTLWPALKAMFPKKVAKRKRRKGKGRAES